MHCKYASKFDDQASFGCLILFFPEDRISAPQFVSPAIRMEIGRLAALKDFTGKSGQCSVLPSPSGAIARLLCVGLGEGEKLDREMLRRAAGTAARELTKMNLETAGVIIPDIGEGMAYQSQLGEIFGEAMIQGAYKFEKYKENQTNSKEKKIIDRTKQNP